MKPSQLMLQFLRAWLDWAEQCAPEKNEYGFHRECGLCYNSQRYILTLRNRWRTIADRRALRHIEVDTLECELKRYFRQKRLDIHYPFNGGDAAAYEHGSFYSLHHLNHNRLQWVRDMLEEHESRLEV